MCNKIIFPVVWGQASSAGLLTSEKGSCVSLQFRASSPGTGSGDFKDFSLGRRSEDVRFGKHVFLSHSQDRLANSNGLAEALRGKRTLKKHADGKRSIRCRSSSSSSSSASDDSETSGTETSSDSSGSSSSRTHKQRTEEKRLARVLKAFKTQKDVVQPAVFDGSDGASLKRFLSEYEIYFDQKFDGTKQQQAKHLVQFLNGPVKRAYDAVVVAK